MKRNFLIGTSLVVASLSAVDARYIATADAEFKASTERSTASFNAVKGIKASLSESTALNEGPTTLLSKVFANKKGRDFVESLLKATSDEDKAEDALIAKLRGLSTTEKTKAVQKIANELAADPGLRALITADAAPLAPVNPNATPIAPVAPVDFDAEGQGPAGDSDAEGQGPAGDSDAEGQGPAGDSDAEGQGPAGDSDAEGQGPAGDSDAEGQGPAGDPNAALVDPIKVEIRDAATNARTAADSVQKPAADAADVVKNPYAVLQAFAAVAEALANAVEGIDNELARREAYVQAGIVIENNAKGFRNARLARELLVKASRVLDADELDAAAARDAAKELEDKAIAFFDAFNA